MYLRTPLVNSSDVLCAQQGGSIKLDNYSQKESIKVLQRKTAVDNLACHCMYRYMYMHFSTKFYLCMSQAKDFIKCLIWQK